ncbi:hypothetical protein [Hathewaya limosa]|uniref:Uncharacterized protein n=1 Tax=Hathewaya limosa TaxID=1536 RepID=A0ABU0JW46_HATLI|nr:hypothetical protein [Hathewaya limosa]MDQ0480461.1 hypothetical protein [Hathewaya limosa]
MHKDQLINLEPSVREQVMREELGEEKCKILDKYGLHPNERIYWEKVQEKYPTQEYFSHKFAVKSSVLGMIFHIYRLCFAKTKYFENNWDKFIPCVYTLREGFIETELYNMEFIKHKKTGLIIDLRELSKIHWIQDFKDLCLYIENKEKELERKIG